MMSNSEAFGDFFANACDAYLEVTACRQCSPLVFGSSPKGVTEIFESREDDLAKRAVGVDTSTRRQRSFCLDDSWSSSRVLLPFLPTGDSQEGILGSRRVRRLEADDEIFRSKKARVFASSKTSEYDEFCKLSRCRAWSQDTENSGTTSSSNERTEETIKQIHWDATLKDTNDLDRLVFM